MKAHKAGLESGSGGGQSIEQEHKALKETLDRLEGTGDLKILIPMLNELRARLELHFAHEEGPAGLHQVVGDSAPHLLTYMQRLFDDHQKLLTAIDGVTERARQCVDGPLAAVLRDVAALSEALRTHEARETALLGDAMYTDLGESS